MSSPYEPIKVPLKGYGERSLKFFMIFFFNRLPFLTDNARSRRTAILNIVIIVYNITIIGSSARIIIVHGVCYVDVIIPRTNIKRKCTFR